MPVVGVTVTVTATATQILPLSTPSNAVSRAMGDPWPSIIRPTGSNTIFLGGAGVTATGSTQGYPLLSTDPPYGFDMVVDDILFGICASGLTSTIAILIGRQ